MRISIAIVALVADGSPTPDGKGQDQHSTKTPHGDRSLAAKLGAVRRSCGGKSGSHGEHDAGLRRVSSAEAASAIRAALPEGAHLLELRANSNGTLNAKGTDTDWIAWAQDDESRRGFFASASPDGRSTQVTLEERDYNEECLGSDLVELDSAFAVPDALERIDGLWNCATCSA
jgi:hypothetical protein